MEAYIVRLFVFWCCLVQIQAGVQDPKETRCWKTLAPIGRGLRQEHGVVASGKNVYILTGLRRGARGEEVTTGDVEVYDTETNTWSEVAPVPLPLHHANVAAVGGSIYVLGGISGPIFGGAPTGKSYRYDIAANKWDQIAEMPYGLGSAAMGVHGETIYMAGGLQAAPKGSRGLGLNTVDIVSSYNTKTDTWTQHPGLKLPEPRDHAGGVVVNGVFYVVAGRINMPNKNRKTVYAVNLTSSEKKWAAMAPLPFERGGVAVAAVGDKIYVFGGEGNANSSKGTFAEVGIFDISKNQSEPGTPMANPRHGFGAVTVGETIYLPGGGLRMGGGELTDINDAYVLC